MSKDNTDPVKLLRKKLARDIKRKAKAKGKPRGKPFVEGEDSRRNVKGSKPRSSVLLRQMYLDIFAEENEIPNPLNGKSEKVTNIYAMGRRQILGKLPADHSEALNRAFGKVPDETRNLSEIDEFILNNIDLLTDAQIVRIQGGEDKRIVLAEILHDAAAILKKNRK